MISKIDMAKITPGYTITFNDRAFIKVTGILYCPVAMAYTIATLNYVPMKYSNQGKRICDGSTFSDEWDIVSIQAPVAPAPWVTTPPVLDEVEWPTESTAEWTPTPKDQPTKRLKILVSGYAHSGKTTFCHYLKLAGMDFVDTSKIAIEKIWNVGLLEGMYESPEALASDKDSVRPLLFCEIERINQDDPTTLARIALEQSDIYCGMRSKRELYGCYDQDLFDLTIWIDRAGPIESSNSCTVDETDFDIIVENTGSIFDLKRKASRLAKVLMR